MLLLSFGFYSFWIMGFKTFLKDIYSSWMINDLCESSKRNKKTKICIIKTYILQGWWRHVWIKSIIKSTSKFFGDDQHMCELSNWSSTNIFSKDDQIFVWIIKSVNQQIFQGWSRNTWIKSIIDYHVHSLKGRLTSPHAINSPPITIYLHIEGHSPLVIVYFLRKKTTSNLVKWTSKIFVLFLVYENHWMEMGWNCGHIVWRLREYPPHKMQLVS